MPRIISIKEALNRDAVFIDTRTPKEFTDDHLPNAINLPILSDEERAIVGTTYKQVSQEKAVDKGIEFFSQKLPGFMSKVNEFRNQEIIFYCWRGGMRSRAVVALLESLKYNVLQLEGGYKQYRNYVRERLENYTLKPKLIVLWGLTCTGKTDLLQKCTNSLDLEGLAQHRGSLYGGIGLKPNSQKRFDNLFLQKLDSLNNQHTIMVEGESRKIGDVQVPSFFYKEMLKGTHILITRSMDNRAECAVSEYFKDDSSIEKIKEITKKLFKVISKENKEKVVKLLEQKEYHKAAMILLELYYDPLYSHTLKERNYASEINNDDIGKAVVELQTFIESLT